MRGLYAIIDVDFLSAAGVAFLPFAEAVLSGHPAVVQLRAKSEAPRAVLEKLRALRAICDREGVPLFANDRPDLAVLGRCDGVHVGQSDVDVADVRAFAPTLRVGVSTHHPSELEAAISARPDYVAFGPVFATASKANPEPVVGLDGLRAAHETARAGAVPLVAIGGIDVARASDVARHAELAAVISALLPPEGLIGVRARVESLGRALASNA